MTDQSNAPASPASAWLNLLFSFKGRIGRVHFLVCLALVVALFACLFTAASYFMDPRGGGGVFIPVTFLLLIAVPWIHSAIVVKRLRDAGRPAWLYFVFGLGPFIWLLATAELFEYFWPVILIVFAALLAAPGFFPTQTPDAVPDSSTS
jgi:uncharacterized membrane protein YhaH (DUF805 family)